jgi:hypothetical protein
MKISELIERLEEVKKEHGNIEVVVEYREDGGWVAYDSNFLFQMHDEDEVTVRKGDGEKIKMRNVIVL